jgi:hypothetical protein
MASPLDWDGENKAAAAGSGDSTLFVDMLAVDRCRSADLSFFLAVVKHAPSSDAFDLPHSSIVSRYVSGAVIALSCDVALDEVVDMASHVHRVSGVTVESEISLWWVT